MRAVTAVACVAAAALGAALSPGRAAPAAVFHAVDRGLCPFPLDVRIVSRPGPVTTSGLKYAFVGPSTITLRNGSTGRRAVLDSPGTFSVDTRTGSVAFRGRHVWFWSSGAHVPFLETEGAGRLVAPAFALAPGSSRAEVVDPCALVAPARPSTRPRTTRAPWGLPRYALSRIAYAGLTPVLGALTRHDHAHVDVIVNGRKVTIPAGVGQAEPVDGGPCPPDPVRVGDCASGHVFAARVANSPLHTHSTSGIVHIESDRPLRFTLGELFDEWGVRLDSRCLGAYCAGGGRALRVFVDGRRVAGDPRSVVLLDRREIAVVYGPPRAFRSVPSTYRGGWPGRGCGGPGEASCLNGR